MSMLYYQWGSRSSETACVNAPASRLGGGNSRVLASWLETRRSNRCRGSSAVPVEPLPHVAESNHNVTFRRIHNEG